MEVEQSDQSLEEPSTTLSADEFAKPLTHRSLASIRSLIVNFSSSEVTISSVTKTLTRSLQHSRNHLVRHQILKVLSDLACTYSLLSSTVYDSVYSFLLHSADSTRLAVDSLCVLASILERNPELVSAKHGLDDHLFVSLCFGPSVSARTWLLNNAEKFSIGPYLLFSVYLGFTKDPYPYVREAALNGLVVLSKSTLFEDHAMIEGCYSGAVELLKDMEDCVRSAAVRAVIAWGLMLVASSPEDKQYRSDDIFVKLSFMTRDMSMDVRVQAFKAMEKIELISGDILLQSISKRVLDITKRKKLSSQYSTEEVLAVNTAGAFVHGVEDEYSEVRQSACRSIRRLTIQSIEFSIEALNILMDILNDDSLFVRLEALETMYYMANFDCLKVQEAHMHMFLSTYTDKNASVRFAVRKIIEIMKLPAFELFKLSIDGLIESLELYPEDEAAIFSALFHTGKNHGNFVIRLVEEVSQKIEPLSEGNLGFDCLKVAALLVLAISTPLAPDQVCTIPTRIFSYAVTLLGRIARALPNIIDQNTLFTYLLKRSRAVEFSDSEFKLNERNTFGTINNCVGTSLEQNRYNDPMDLRASIRGNQLKNDGTESINDILGHTKDIWPLIQSGLTNEALSSLRFCKESLSLLTSSSSEHNAKGNLAFALRYIEIVKLLAKVWDHHLPEIRPRLYKYANSGVLLRKLDRKLRELRSRFSGFSSDQELHILELVLLTCIIKLSQTRICCHLPAFRQLTNISSHIDSILRNGYEKPSIFVIEVGQVLSNISLPTRTGLCSSSTFRKLLEFFTLNHFAFHGRLEYVEAELSILDNDYEHPLCFVPGLPVGIPCKIVLHNISSEKRLWVRMKMDNEITRFVFMDFVKFGGRDEFREFTFVAPFYGTPKATSFITKVCVGMECLFEDGLPVRGRGGPKRELTFICEEKDVYLSIFPGD